MNPTEEARSRQTDAVLVEALRHDVPADLEARLLARVATPREQVAGPARWLIAAALLLGSAIVFAVANASSDGGALAEAQDPKPVRITTAHVKAARKAIVVPPEAGDARDRLMAIAKVSELNIGIAAGVKGHSEAHLAGMSAETAIRAIASDVGATLAEFDGIVAIGVAGKPRTKASVVTMQNERLTVRAFFKKLHAQTGVNFVVGDDVKGSLAIDVKNVPWRELLDVVAKRLEFGAVGHGSVFAITKRVRRVKQRVYFAFEDAAVTRIFSTCSKISGLNTVVDAGVGGKMTLRARNVSSHEALRVAAACVGARVNEGQIVRIELKKAGGTTSLTAEACDLKEQLGKWIKAIPGAKLDCTVDGTFAAFVDRVDVRELLRATALATGHAVEVDDGTFTIR